MTAVFKRIVWATDGSAQADRALPIVKSLATDAGASVVVVHGQEFTAGAYASSQPVHPDEEDRERKIYGQADELTGAGIATEVKVESAVGVGAARLIADAAGEANADLIVAGTRGQSPIVGLLVGSVTQRLLHIAPCPVLVIPAADG
jgi:nucleotide-binding universal stress UspA family protein